METISSSAEISRLFSEGAWVKTPFLTLIVGKREQEGHSDAEHGLPGRVAFIAGKKLGGAVWRNRAKRRMRAVARELGGPWSGHDIIFLARGSVTQAKYSKVLDACAKALARGLQGE